MVRKIPLPTAAMIPLGPFQLSTQPLTGSRRDESTGNKEKTDINNTTDDIEFAKDYERKNAMHMKLQRRHR